MNCSPCNRPSACSDRAEILHAVAEEEPIPIRRLNPAVPVDLATIVAKAMRKDPSARYDTAWELAEDLVRYCAGTADRGPSGRATARGAGGGAAASRCAAALAASLILALVGGIARHHLELARGRAAEGLVATHERDQKEAQRRAAAGPPRRRHCSRPPRPRRSTIF